MGENIQYKRFLPLVILTVGILLQGCKDDVFNPEKVKAAYQDRFPVKNIDPAMDWKMTQQVRVNVSVSEDTGIDYTIRIYDKNPLITGHPPNCWQKAPPIIQQYLLPSWTALLC